MLPSSLLCSILISIFVSLVAAQQNVFYNPLPRAIVHDYSQNPTYTIGSTVNLQWSTSYKNLSLVLWQKDNPVNEYLLQTVSTRDNFEWKVATNQHLAKGIIFFLGIYDEDDSNNSFSSHYFNLTKQKASGGGSTTKKPSSTLHTSIKTGTKTTRHVSSTGTATSTGTSSPSSSGSNSGSSGLSTGAKVGLGVGIPVALIVGAAAGFWFFRSRSRQRKVAAQSIDPSPMHQDQVKQEQKQPLSPNMAVEAPTENDYHELPGNSRQL